MPADADKPALRASANPWPGLATYTEAAQASFKGRDEEIEELLRRVANARLTVLFGKSGLGKSSLILAGLFPRMRALHLLPVYVRLELRSDRLPLIDQVRQALIEQLRAHQVDAPPFEEGEGLWQYLHRRDLELWSRSNHLLTPVFVLDQFEEIFTLGDSNPTAVAEFRSDFGNLAENGIPRELAARIEDNPELCERLDVRAWKYRMLVSLREDFLPHLEGWRRSIASLGGNRMRLLPMRRQQAFVAVYDSAPRGDAQGAPELVSKELAWKIVNHVSAASLRHAMTPVRPLTEKETQLLYSSVTDTSPTIEPALLSLFCAGLYQRWLNETGGDPTVRPFDDKLLEGAKEAIIEDFYHESVHDLPDRVAEFIETELITERGFRDSFPREDAIQKGALTESELQTLIDRRLLRLEQHHGIPRIELTHDILTRAVREERDRRQREQERRKLEERAAEEKRKAEDAQRALQHYKIEQERIALLKRTRRQGALITGISGAALLFLGLGGVAAWQWARSNEQASRALSAKLALQAVNMRDGREQGDLATSLRLAIASQRRYEGEDGQRAVRLALDASRPVMSTVAFDPAPTAVAYSPDGGLLAVATRARKIVLLDGRSAASTGRELVGHGDPVRQLAFSPDGMTLASASFDGSVILWDAQSGARRGDPLGGGRDAALTCVAFSPDGKQFAVGGIDGKVVVRDSGSRQFVREFNAGEGLFSLAYSGDGQWIAAGTRSGKVQLWRAGQSGAPVTFTQPVEAGELTPVFNLAFSPDSRWLAAAGRRQRAMLIDLQTRQRRDVDIAQRDGVRALAFSRDSLALATASAAGEIALWSVPAGVRQEVSLRLHHDAVMGLSFAPDGNRLASVGRDGSLIVWDLRHLVPLGDPLVGAADGALTARVQEDSRTVVSVDRGGALLQWYLPGPGRAAGTPLWDERARVPVSEVRNARVGTLREATMSANGRIAALIGRDGGLQLWPFADGRSPIPLSGARIGDAAFSLDGKVLAAINRSNEVELWRLDQGAMPANGRPWRVLRIEGSKLLQAALSPDHRILATADSDNAIRLWRTEDAGSAPPPPLAGHGDRVLALAFSADGRWLASAGRDSLIILWDVATGRPLRTPLLGHRDAIRSVAFSPDNTLLASAGDDESVIFWSLPGGEPLGVPLHLHDDAIRDLAFSPDGRWLVSAGLDKRVVAWSVERLAGEGAIARFDSAQSVKALCDKVSENLSPAAWARFAGQGVAYVKQCPDKPVPS